MSKPADSLYLRYAKRLLDVTVASAALATCVPVLGVAAIAVRVALGSPVLFRQRRAGRNGTIFTLIKLRTMLDALGPDGALLPDDERLTAFGAWLRRTSLDELPELINVLKGEMSMVGPRPLHERYLPRYCARQARRHDIRPGLTGLAQVRGRNGISWARRFELDLEYVEKASLRLDLQILLETLWVIVRQTGVSAQGEATMPEFWGSAGPPSPTPDTDPAGYGVEEVSA